MEHAGGVLQALGVRQLFPRIIDIRALEFLCKPLEEAYLRALQIAGLGSAEGVLLVEDSERNIAPAVRLGFQTVHLSLNGSSGSAHRTIRSLYELTEIYPELWK
jgi:FMN phosphatase YigB (HAD superfamily)